MKLKLALLLITTVVLGGCVVNPYYEDDYDIGYRSPSVRYYEPCCGPSRVIIRQHNYYRPQPYHRPYYNQQHWGNGHNNFNHRPPYGHGPRR